MINLLTAPTHISPFPAPTVKRSRSMPRKRHALFTPLLILAATVVATVVAAMVDGRTAYAQGAGTGSADGFVTDQGGNPLRGVKIVAQSRTLIGKGRTTYTSAEGTFHMGGLTPGKYTFTATSPGLETVVQENIELGIASPAEINVMMQVKTAEQRVVIVEKRQPVISTTKAAVQQNYDQQLIEAIPFRDTVNQFRDIVHSAPGSINLRVRGASATQTAFLEDGFEIRDIFPPIRSAQAFEVQTSAYGADAPTWSGGVSNMVTRSGSNDFEFQFQALTVGSWGELFKDNLDTNAGINRWMVNPTISGPIIKDKLWYHLNIEVTETTTPIPRDLTLTLPEQTPQFSVFPKVVGKVSWQVTPRNKIELLFNGDTPYIQNNRLTPGVADSANQDRLAQRYFAGATWESLLTNNLLFRSQAGWIAFFEEIQPAICRTLDAATCLNASNTRQTAPQVLETGNSPVHTIRNQQSLQFINTLEYFLSTAHFGEHKLRLRDFVLVDRDIRSTVTPSNFNYETVAGVPTFRTEFFANDPRLAPGQYGWFRGTTRQQRHVLTLSDTAKFARRVTAIAAMSLVQARGSNSTGTFPYSANTWAPALSLVWDITGDGKNILRSSGSVYVDVDLTNISRFAIGTQVTQRCAASGSPTMPVYDTNCQYAGGASSSTIGNLQTPKTYEATLGGAREVIPGTALSLDFVYRKFVNQYEDYETNRIWNASGSSILGTVNGQPNTVLNLDTLGGAQRTWKGATLALSKKGGALIMEGSYTLAKLEGTVLDGFQNAYGTIPAQDALYLNGVLDDDHRHEIKLVADWLIQPWLSAGIRYNYYSGLPRKRLFYNSATGTYSILRAPNGIDPGADRNSPLDDFIIRTPDQQDFNLQVRMQLLPLIGHDLSFIVQVLNVLALRTPLTFNNNDGAAYGTVLTRMDPFRIRVGIDYAWGGGDRRAQRIRESGGSM